MKVATASPGTIAWNEKALTDAIVETVAERAPERTRSIDALVAADVVARFAIAFRTETVEPWSADLMIPRALVRLAAWPIVAERSFPVERTTLATEPVVAVLSRLTSFATTGTAETVVVREMAVERATDAVWACATARIAPTWRIRVAVGAATVVERFLPLALIAASVAVEAFVVAIAFPAVLRTVGVRELVALRARETALETDPAAVWVVALTAATERVRDALEAWVAVATNPRTDVRVAVFPFVVEIAFPAVLTRLATAAELAASGFPADLATDALALWVVETIRC